MDIKQITAGLEARAKALSIPIYSVCEQAGISPATFYRWASGTHSPTIVKVNAISAKLDELERAKG